MKNKLTTPQAFSMINTNKILAEKIRETSWGLCDIADTLERNMLTKDIDDFGPPLDQNIEAHLIMAFKIMAHQLNADTEDLDDFDFVKRENN